MTKKQGDSLGLIPIRDYISEDRLCVICGKNKCDTYFVKGYSHSVCYHKEDKK